jgi:PKD repeat protein
MKKIRSFRKTFLGMAAVAASLFLASSCGEDDPAAPKAGFTYEADGREVTFTNTSTNATSYEWDFGDGSTSTEKSPVHTYSVFGEYTVVLKVKGAGGEDTSLPDLLTLAKSSDVVIDGNFADWADVPEVTAPEKFGTITKVKVDYDALKIYFYVEGTAGPGGPGVTAGGLNGFFDIYLNTDNNPATGYFSGWYPEGYGADYLIEGDLHIVKDAPVFKFDETGPVTAFDFNVDTPAAQRGSNVVKSSAMTAVGNGKGIEFSVSRSIFTNLASKFTFAVVDVDGNDYFPPGTTPEKSRNYAETWATLGSYPKDNTPTGKMIGFDLTK